MPANASGDAAERCRPNDRRWNRTPKSAPTRFRAKRDAASASRASRLSREDLSSRRVAAELPRAARALRFVAVGGALNYAPPGRSRSSKAPGSGARRSSCARYGERWRPAILPGGHHSGCPAASGGGPPSSRPARRYSGAEPVSSTARRMGWNALGCRGEPKRAAIASAAASACCVAPPCLTGKSAPCPLRRRRPLPSRARARLPG
jgi:hypothetical protein